MKTITISVNDETYRRCQLRADAVGKTVDALVSGYLTDLVGKPVSDAERERLNQRRRELVARIQARGGGLLPAENLPREKLYDRDALLR